MSPATGRLYPLTMICEVWRMARSPVYGVRDRATGSQSVEPKKRGPKTELSDEELLVASRRRCRTSCGHGRDAAPHKAGWLVLVLRRGGSLRHRRGWVASGGEGRPLGRAGADPPGANMDGYVRKVALGLGLRHDWGPQYTAHQCQGELRVARDPLDGLLCARA
jgi:hypothetical protein